MAEEGYKVLLNVYDLSQGLAKQLSSSLLGKVIEGIWHTGVVVYGNEYYYGGGVQSSPQGQAPYGRPLRQVELGYTQIPKEMFEDYLQEIRPRYSEQTYSLLHHNCNNFSEEIAQFLVGAGIPEYILRLPEEVMNSPMAALIMPMVQQVETTLRYGGVPEVPSMAANFAASNVAMNGSIQGSPLKAVSTTTVATAATGNGAVSTATASNVAMNGSIQGSSLKPVSATTVATAAMGNGAVSSATDAASSELPKVDALSVARTRVQEEITKEFMALMAEGRLRASEAAAVATRRVMERHGRGIGLTLES